MTRSLPTFLKKCQRPSWKFGMFWTCNPSSQPEVRGLDHAFFFTLRDSVNLGDKDHMLLLLALSETSQHEKNRESNMAWKSHFSSMIFQLSSIYSSMVRRRALHFWDDKRQRTGEFRPHSLLSITRLQDEAWGWSAEPSHQGYDRCLWDWSPQHEHLHLLDRNCSGLLPDLIIFQSYESYLWVNKKHFYWIPPVISVISVISVIIHVFLGFSIMNHPATQDRSVVPWFGKDPRCALWHRCDSVWEHVSLSISRTK